MSPRPRITWSHVPRVIGHMYLRLAAIRLVGLLIASVVRTKDVSPHAIALNATNIARHRNRFAPSSIASGGQRAGLHRGTRSAHGEAEDGFPHVVSVALPALREARRRGLDEDTARLDALRSVMTSIDDTCLPHKGAPEAADLLTAALFLDRVERDSSLAIAVQSREEVDDSWKHSATSTRASTPVDLAQLTTGATF